MRKILAGALFAALAGVPWRAYAQADAPALWAGLSPGSHQVGYRRLAGAAAPIHVWYPASAGGERMLLRGYLGSDDGKLAAFLTRVGIPPATVTAFLDSRLYAVPSAPAIAGALPLLLVAKGNGGDVVDQVVLCEYLASQGYVVATTPSPMLRTPMEREDQVGQFAEMQAADLAAAMSAVSATFNVDSGRIAVVGHSFGARAALLLAMRGRRLRAFVSLDGGIGTATAVDVMRAAPSFRSDAPLPPLLHFYEELDPFMTPDFTLLRSLRAARLLLEPVTGMHHQHFTTYGFAASIFPEIATATHATAETPRSVVAVAERTRDFLRDQLR